MMASATLREALERSIRYERLVNEAAGSRLSRLADCYRFVIDVPEVRKFTADEAIDAFAAIAVRVARALHADRHLSPLAVHLCRSEPSESGAFHRVFRCPITFSAEMNAIDFAHEDVEKPLPTGNAELARHNDEVIRQYLARLDTARVSSRVQTFLVEGFPDGEPTQTTVAQKLGMSTRNLQRRLADEGTTYKDILNESRASLARDYVREGRCSVTEIAFLLGFADTSTFSRAFKRWTGASPRQYAAGAS